MRTLLILLLTSLSASVAAQAIPDFNPNFKTQQTASAQESGEKMQTTYDKGKTTVMIPEELKGDMGSLMGITGDQLDAGGTFDHYKDAKRRIDALIKTRQCTKIEGDTAPTGCTKTEFLPAAGFNDKMMKISDSIERYTVLRDFFEAANGLGGNPSLWRRFFPVHSVMQAKYFFIYNNDEQGIMFIDKVGLQTDFSSSYSANANLVTGIIPLKPLPLKFTMATNITQQTSDLDSLAAAKLVNGGLLNFSVLAPVFFSKWYVEEGKKVVFYLPVEYRFNMDNVRDKLAFSDTYHYHELSAYLMGTFDLLQNKSDTDQATLFGAVKMSYYNGGHQFSTKLSANKFWTAQASLGIKIKDKYTLSANIPFWSDDEMIRSQQVATFGITFQPAKKE